MKETALQRQNVSNASKDNNSKQDPGSNEIAKFVRAAEVIIVRRTLRFQWLLPKNTDPDIAELDKIVSLLQSTYKDFLDSRLLQESWSENNCLTVFDNIAREVLNSEEERENGHQRCSWSRIGMLIAVACRMAQHLRKQGATNGFVRSFSRHVGKSLADNVSACGNQQDVLWNTLRTRNSGASSPDLLGVGMMVVSAVWTVAILLQPSPFLLNLLKE